MARYRRNHTEQKPALYALVDPISPPCHQQLVSNQKLLGFALMGFALMGFALMGFALMGFALIADR
jgi:hypothetical protein